MTANKSWIRGAARVLMAISLLGGGLTASRVSLGAVAHLIPSKDNTLFEDLVEGSNGAGVYMFSGGTRFVGARRALMSFNIAGAIPAGSTITAVTLRMNVSKVAPFTSTNSFKLYKVQQDWGESTSDAGEPGGNGAQAEAGDATWQYTFFNTASWTNPGGDFAASSSGTTPLSGLGFATWASSAGLVADVQSWLGAPAANYGWILIGNESRQGSALRFDSRENPYPQNRPLLTVTYSTTAVPVGTVPDGYDVPGTELTVVKGPGTNLTLSWAHSCVGSDSDYEVYEGLIGNFSSHVPKLCSTSGATAAAISPAAGNRYYLVVATDGSFEGSYGRRSSGAQRPQSASSCRPQLLGQCP